MIQTLYAASAVLAATALVGLGALIATWDTRRPAGAHYRR